ncbi:nitroreductase family protein [Nocardiopsis potens]|uniref:nitroreductase family protein n=1 Tax=Nocardiopsis potens TaxID=1246458 RepID=UPI00034DA022|nr:nitroreductase family protein [Nocardiopsis potens]
MPMFTREAVRADVESLLRSGHRRRSGLAAPPRPDASAERWAEALRDRRSHREYDDRPVPRDLLGRVVASAVRSCGEDPGRGDGLELYLAVNEGGRSAAISEYGTGTALGSARACADAARILARDYTPAPVTVLIAGGPVPNAAEHYGGLLVRAGALGYACWLSGRAAGLEGCAFGRTGPEVDRLLRCAGRGSRHLFTVTLGFAPEPRAGGR